LLHRYRKDYAPLPWSVGSVDLLFNLKDGTNDEERATQVTSSMQLQPQAHRAASDDLVLDCEDLELLAVKVIETRHLGMLDFLPIQKDRSY